MVSGGGDDPSASVRRLRAFFAPSATALSASARFFSGIAAFVCWKPSKTRL